MPHFDFSHKPTGWQKWVLRAPTYLYRARLGFVFGHRLLMLEHRGRTSGVIHRTVIEVAGRLGDEWVCTSGTGPRSDWYQNLRVNGVEAVWLGSTRHTASVRFLPAEDAAHVMARYENAHPKVSEKLFESMGVSYDGSDQDRVEMMRGIPMVALTLDP